MFGTPVDRTLKEGFQGQAKIIGLVVRNVLKEYYSQNISKNQMKDVVDAIFTALHSINYYKESSSAEEFLRFHVNQIQEIEDEVEFLEDFEG